MEERKIDYNVYNSLNLMAQELGELYLNESYNPFGKGFILDENFAKLLISLKNKKVKIPEFLSAPKDKIIEAFQRAELSTLALFEASKSKVNLICEIGLKNRATLLKLYNGKLKRKNCNVQTLYKSLCGFDSQLSEVLEESFLDSFVFQSCLNRILMDFNKRNKVTEKRPNIKISIKTNIEKKNIKENETVLHLDKKEIISKEKIKEKKEDEFTAI